ncbi:endoribonuclease Dicer homolog 2a isoform X2 [Lolium perenne]|uniref:endoribonuclease Dicer homolog 2a isoform X2 n=1 Tax=Lolium perenne TaxID=4522 RepID=UPI0021F58D17|nr:endoribonuclease Dicer homolog 2a-like isoform X2 [Lolium perenne]
MPSVTTMDDPAAAAAPTEDQQTLPRWYQLEALERAMSGNTVVFLDTGAGKTLIAGMLLRAYAHRVRKPARDFAVFLVPNRVLVEQQARVVQAHTDLRVSKFTGDMGVDFWNAATWRRVVDDAEVLVMTPQILLDNLLHSFFRLQDIALLIFDECHRAKGNYPYACILKEFYHPQLNSRPQDPLPRIFGMTASPTDTKNKQPEVYSKQIFDLENLLNSKVYTVDNQSTLSDYLPLATTQIVHYDSSIIPSNTYNHIKSCLERLKEKHFEVLKANANLYGSSLENAKKGISKLHKTFLYCTANLGVWLAAKAAEVQSTTNEQFLPFWGDEKLDKNVEGFVRNYSEEVYRELSCFSTRGHIGEDFVADLQDGLLTHKVHCLVQFLLEYRHMEDLRCIVFVERVITSIVLESLLSTISQMSGRIVKHIAGNRSLLHHQSRNKQTEIVDSFRGGKVHIIVATQVLEEGVDVPSCHLVIRFDLPATARGFIQSRGRARMPNSDYVLLVRRGDAKARSKIEKFLGSGQMMREASLRLASSMCKPLQNTLCEEDHYHVESTGAIVTMNSSVKSIYFFCSKLPSDEYFQPLPRFSIDKALGTCTLYLPKSSPVQIVNIEGEVSILKKAVCLKACRELHAIGALTDHLLPELGFPCEEEPDIVVEKYQHEHPDYFPEEFVHNWLSFSRLGIYYCYKISVEGCSKTTSCPNDILLAVKCELGPDFVSSSIQLCGVQDYASVAMKYVGIIHLNQEQVIMARRFQTTILSLLVNKGHPDVSNASKYFHEMQVSIGVVYLLLPLVSGKVDWCSIKFSASQVYDASNKDMMHCHSCKQVDILQTKDGPLCRHGLNLTHENQPLLAASKPGEVRNFLQKRHYKNKKEPCTSYSVELPPELCRLVMSPVSTNTLFIFSIIPSVMYRIQCLLLSAKLKVQLGPRMQQFAIPALKVLEAVTTKECQEEFSQESLETLGDSFLKYVVTQHLYCKYTLHHEGTLTKMKKNLISNAALCQLACNNNLVGYIQGAEFNPKGWIIPGLGYHTCGRSKTLCLSSNDMYSLSKMSVRSKRIADTVEALIGAYLSAAGEQAAFLFLKSLGLDIEFHQKIPFERKIVINYEKFINVRSLEIILGYEFKDPSFLMEALTHGSYQIAGTTACYQRLEFLGDAVLDHLFTIYYYNHYPECTPELLTNLRSASVNNCCYAHAAAKAGLNKHILHMSSELHKRMANYLEKSGQPFTGPSHGWEAGIGLPKVLGDAIESIAAAIYVDSKFDKEVVWRSMKRLLEPLATPDTVECDPVKELQEFCDRKSYSKSYTKTHKDGVSSVVAEVQVEGTSYSAIGTGPDKSVAKKLAAKSLLKNLKAKL